MSKIVVTGGAGFIASHLIERLLDKGHRVIALDDLSLGSKDNLKSSVDRDGFEFLEMDLSLPSVCEKLAKLEGVSEVWHLAANSDIRAGNANPDVDLNRTFLTTFYLLKWMESKNIGKLLFASSSAVYGEQDHPIHELSAPLEPISNYGAMKLASEAIISAAKERFLDQIWIFRFPNVIGPRTTHGILYDFRKKLLNDPSRLEVLGDGSQQKPYCHVEDLVDAMMFCRDHSNQDRNTFNIGTSETSTSVRFIAETFVDQWDRLKGVRPEIRLGDGKKGWVGDVAKFSYSTKKINELGWKPRLSSNEAVERAIEQVLNEPL